MIDTTRRKILGGMVVFGGAYGLGLATPRIVSYLEETRLRRAIAAVLPLQSIPTGLDIGRPVARLVAAGAIAPRSLSGHTKFVVLFPNGCCRRWREDLRN